jgi:hypothetical protein
MISSYKWPMCERKQIVNGGEDVIWHDGSKSRFTQIIGITNNEKRKQ